MRFDFEVQICISRSKKRMTLLRAGLNAGKSPKKNEMKKRKTELKSTRVLLVELKKIEVEISIPPFSHYFVFFKSQRT